MRKQFFALGFVLAALAFNSAAPFSALAQTPPAPPPTSWLPNNVSPPTLNVTTTGVPTVLPAPVIPYSVITFINVGSAEVFCRPGGASVSVTSTNYMFSVPGGAWRAIWDATDDYVSCVTATGTSTVRISQSNGGPSLGALLAGAGGGGGGDASAANQALQLTQETKTATGIGAPADTTCASDSGSCGLIAQVKRLLAAITTLNTNVTSPVPAGTNTLGGTTPVAAATGGATPATVISAASTNATNLKASAGTLYHIAAYGNSAVPAYLSLYNTAGTPTCGTGIVYETLIPANSTSGAGAVEDFGVGLNFSTGIGYCITTAAAGTGSVAAGANIVSFGSK